MKATFQNIGPIKQAELELGDLTVIAGQNNTGKTYLAYTLYGFLKFWQDERDVRFFNFRKTSNVNTTKQLIPKQLSQEMGDTGKTTMEIKKYIEIRDKLVKEMSEDFSSAYIDRNFSSPDGQFKGATFSFEFSTNKDGNSEIDVGVRSRRRARIRAYFKGNNLVFEDIYPVDKSTPKQEWAGRLHRSLLGITQKQYPEPFILSAERFGISLFYKELDFKKNRLIERLQNWSNEKGLDPFIFLEEESARYSKSIKDNIDFTRDLPEIQKEKSTLVADEKRSVEGMLLARFKATDNEIRLISAEKSQTQFNIPLHLASSSARGLSDLYFYLRHVAKPGQLLIIDEPESHLSPKNQVLMARLLAFCVNNGIKVLVTTHSDYLIKEINNLIMLHGEFEGKKDFLKRHEEDYTESDSLNPNAVCTYVCENGGLTPCDIDSMGMNMPVFDDAIDKINEISNELGLMREPSTQHD